MRAIAHPKLCPPGSSRYTFSSNVDPVLTTGSIVRGIASRNTSLLVQLPQKDGGLSPGAQIRPI